MFCVPSGCTVREVKVKASAVRRGSVIDVDGKLLVVVDASFVKTAMRRAQITVGRACKSRSFGSDAARPRWKCAT